MLDKYFWNSMINGSKGFYANDISFGIHLKVTIGGQSLTYPELGLADLFHCREVLCAEFHDFLHIANELCEEIDFFREKDRAPGKNFLIGGYLLPKSIASRKGLLPTLDCLVALPAMLVNPDRYLGNWWQTGELRQQGDIFRYYGIDNTIAYHPALLSLVLGLFRQAILIFEAGESKNLLKAVSHKEVTRALNTDNVDAALALVNQAKPWLMSQINSLTFPIRKEEGWQMFLNLHRSLYAHGFERTLGTPEQGWQLESLYSNNLGYSSYFRKRNKERIGKLAQRA